MPRDFSSQLVEGLQSGLEVRLTKIVNETVKNVYPILKSEFSEADLPKYIWALIGKTAGDKIGIFKAKELQN